MTARCWRINVFILQVPLPTLVWPFYSKDIASILWSEKCIAWLVRLPILITGESKNISILEKEAPEELIHVCVGGEVPPAFTCEKSLMMVCSCCVDRSLLGLLLSSTLRAQLKSPPPGLVWGWGEDTIVS